MWKMDEATGFWVWTLLPNLEAIIHKTKIGYTASSRLKLRGRGPRATKIVTCSSLAEAKVKAQVEMACWWSKPDDMAVLNDSVLGWHADHNNSLAGGIGETRFWLRRLRGRGKDRKRYMLVLCTSQKEYKKVKTLSSRFNFVLLEGAILAEKIARKLEPLQFMASHMEKVKVSSK